MSAGPGRPRDVRRAVVIGALAFGTALSGVMAACQEARPAETAESLTADPERLAAVQEACRTNAPGATDALCRAAAEARRRRFQGDGVRYAPHRTDPFPREPQPSPGTLPARPL